MLQFFRRYQKFFFLFTTIIIVVSFVFFGTYQAFAPSFSRSSEPDEVLFKAADKQPIKASYVKAMGHFLSSESWMSQRAFYGNYLNDGVISQEFLAPGLADLLIPFLGEEYVCEIENKFVKEKEFEPFRHPILSFLSAESIWSLFAPEIPKKLKAFKSFEWGSEDEAFKARVSLFLAEKSFPPSLLAQVVRYQMRDNPSLARDPSLAKEDFTLFGYHDLSDWFGEVFIDAVSRVIIQTAAIAREKGYRVSKDEALSEILYKSQKTYETLKERVELPIQDGFGLLQMYLRQSGIEETEVVKIWEDISLFQRLMHEVGNGALVDVLGLKQFYEFAHENALIELVQLPKEFRFQTFLDLKRFEAYLAAVGERKANLLDLPSKYAPLEVIDERAPELMGKKYRVYVTEVAKNSLQGKVSVKETYQWELAPENWAILTKQFPELAQKVGSPDEILEAADPKFRKVIDGFARKEIANGHPEWVESALKEKNMDEKELFISLNAKKPLLNGILDPIALGELLDEKEEIVGYTQDGENYYRILVQERMGWKVLTFKEALEKELLDEVAERLHIERHAEEILSELAFNLEKGQAREEGVSFRFKEYLENNAVKEEGELKNQWQSEKRELTLTRSEPSFIGLDQALYLDQEYSPILVDLKEGPFCYRVLEKKIDRTIPLEKIVDAQELLSIEARKHFFENLVKEVPFSEVPFS